MDYTKLTDADLHRVVADLALDLADARAAQKEAAKAYRETIKDMEERLDAALQVRRERRAQLGAA